MPLPLLGVLLDPHLRSGGLCTSPPTLVPIPLSVEMMLARGLSTPDTGETGGGGSDVFSTDEVLPAVAILPLLGSVRESILRGEWALGTDGASTLVGNTTLEPTLSGLKALREGVWKPSIFSRLSFCSTKKQSKVQSQVQFNVPSWTTCLFWPDTLNLVHTKAL